MKGWSQDRSRTRRNRGNRSPGGRLRAQAADQPAAPRAPQREAPAVRELRARAPAPERDPRDVQLVRAGEHVQIQAGGVRAALESSGWASEQPASPRRIRALDAADEARDGSLDHG